MTAIPSIAPHIAYEKDLHFECQSRHLKCVKFCYCDESGTGDEPIAVMVGILVDAQRMHLTKHDWEQLLSRLSAIASKAIPELHTREFYSGKGIWHNVNGTQRAQLISEIFHWLADRKHHVVYSSVVKKAYFDSFKLQHIPDELHTVWRFLGFHLTLAIQKYCQTYSKNKGHTVFIFDNEERERMRFTDVIQRPPPWSEAYYGKKPKDQPLDQVVDVPYFGDSKEVALIQVADVLSFFLRRYAEVKEHLTAARYPDEETRLTAWMKIFGERSIGSSFMYPKVGRGAAEDLFYNHAPDAIRNL